MSFFWLKSYIFCWLSTGVTQISVNVDNFSGETFYSLSNNEVHSHSLDSWFLKPQIHGNKITARFESMLKKRIETSFFSPL